MIMLVPIIDPPGDMFPDGLGVETKGCGSTIGAYEWYRSVCV